MFVQAATLVEPRRYQLREYPLPEPRSGCVLVKMDLSEYTAPISTLTRDTQRSIQAPVAGRRIPFPIIQGHENVGTVAAIGGDGKYNDFEGVRLRPATASW